MGEQAITLVKQESNKYNNKLTNFQCYVFYFFIFSFIGWAMETIYSYIVLGHFTNRGFFYGPICPIYGCGGLILIMFLSKYNNNPIKLFIYATLIFSVFEYFISYELDALYNLWLWDYTNEFFNINGRICLFYSAAWGMVALIFTYVLFPLIKKFLTLICNKIPTFIQILFIRFFSMIFIADIIYSFIEYSHITIL